MTFSVDVGCSLTHPVVRIGVYFFGMRYVNFFHIIKCDLCHLKSLEQQPRV